MIISAVSGLLTILVNKKETYLNKVQNHDMKNKAKNLNESSNFFHLLQHDLLLLFFGNLKYKECTIICTMTNYYNMDINKIKLSFLNSQNDRF